MQPIITSGKKKEKEKNDLKWQKINEKQHGQESSNWAVFFNSNKV